MMINTKLCILVLTAVLTPGVVHGTTASDIARRAQVADKHVSYRGMKTAEVAVGRKTVSSAMKVTHMKPDMTRTQYFSPAALAGVVVIQSGPDVWRYDARQRVWVQVNSAASMPADLDREGAFANYDIRLVGSDKIAGREAYIVRASPRRKVEACRRIWIDKKSYLTLKTQVENPSGAVLSSSRFTVVTVNPTDVSPTDFAVTGRVISAPKAGRVDFHVEKPRYLPKGYKPVGVAKDKVSGRMCVHLQFSNGVNTISLFERRSECNTCAPRVPEKLTTVMTWAKDQMLFTLVGDVSRAELTKIANSTR
jgi:negative regulator of sigma E activity